jgi:hypothetical protein
VNALLRYPIRVKSPPVKNLRSRRETDDPNPARTATGEEASGNARRAAGGLIATYDGRTRIAAYDGGTAAKKWQVGTLKSKKGLVAFSIGRDQ